MIPRRTPVALDSSELQLLRTPVKHLTSGFVPLPVLFLHLPSGKSRFPLSFLPVYSVAGLSALGAGSVVLQAGALLHPPLAAICHCIV